MFKILMLEIRLSSISMKLFWYMIVHSICFQVHCHFEIPDLQFQAFNPKGLRIIISDDSKLELVAFHGKVNQPIGLLEPGDINQDLLKATKNNRFIYLDPEIKLKENDTLYYWVFIQHDQLGYRKDNLSWTVNKLLPLESLREPINNVQENKIEYRFTENSIAKDVWQIEEYIPGRPDWPYNIYQNDPSVVNVSNGVLHIVPHLQINNTRSQLDLRENCTRLLSIECFRDGRTIWNPPVVSGQLRSKVSFRFSNVTIKAKLPIGDYVYPEIYLEDVIDPEKKIFIAFLRGNENYEKNGVDIGGKTLYGGIYINILEISNHRKGFPEHVGKHWHVFSVTWIIDTIQLYVDNENYANVSATQLRNNGFNKTAMYRLVLGIGIAGPRFFPEGYTSSGRSKPYKNLGRDAIKNFAVNREKFINTWSEETQLQIEVVSVEAEIY